jgi:hypothetical protein
VGRFSAETEEVLRTAGWFPGRKIDTASTVSALKEDGFVPHDSALTFLREFGNLHVDVHGSGVSCARVPFAFDPLEASGEQDRFLEWGESLGVQLLPIGYLDHHRYLLGIDHMGDVYLVADWVSRFGAVDSALEKLILGIASEDVVEQ